MTGSKPASTSKDRPLSSTHPRHRVIWSRSLHLTSSESCLNSLSQFAQAMQPQCHRLPPIRMHSSSIGRLQVKQRSERWSASPETPAVETNDFSASLTDFRSLSSSRNWCSPSVLLRSRSSFNAPCKLIRINSFR